MLRVLEIITCRLGYEGITNVVMNCYESMDRKLVQMDFVVGETAEGKIAEKICRLGGKIYNVPSRKQSVLEYMKELCHIVKAGGYKVAHIHGNGATMVVDAAAVFLGGARVRIAHSHSSATDHPFFHALFKLPLNILATHIFACSQKAGRHISYKKYTVFHNGISAERYAFDNEARMAVRAELRLGPDVLVIGHVGRFDRIKNHTFLLEVFEKVRSRVKDARLLLVGEGETKTEVMRLAAEKKLADSVIVLEKRSDVNRLMQAMDVFVFPSVEEGLGIAAIEAQAADLPVIASKGVPCEVKVGAETRVKFLGLEEGAGVWAETTLKYAAGRVRRNNARCFKNSDYNIRRSAKKLQKFYLSFSPE